MHCLFASSQLREGTRNHVTTVYRKSRTHVPHSHAWFLFLVGEVRRTLIFFSSHVFLISSQTWEKRERLGPTGWKETPSGAPWFSPSPTVTGSCFLSRWEGTFE